MRGERDYCSVRNVNATRMFFRSYCNFTADT